MATKTKEKPKAKPRKAEAEAIPVADTPVPVTGDITIFEPSEDQTRNLPIRWIRTNSENPRESAPQLTGVGWGLFARIEGSGKPCMVELALSDEIQTSEGENATKADDLAEYVKLIDKFEQSIAEMAQDITVNGLIHAVTVRPLKDGSGYDLVVGCRRVLAALYNYCKEGMEPNIRATVRAVADHQALYMAFSENAHRLNMSPIEQARWYAQMRNTGLKVQEIAERTKVDHQIIRQRLDLLKLPQDLQDKVHEGELGVVKALKLVKGKADPKSPGATGKGPTGDGTRRKVPSLKDFSTMYEDRADLNEKVREWIALEILQIPYMTFKDLQKEKEKVAALESDKEGEGKKKGRKKADDE